MGGVVRMDAETGEQVRDVEDDQKDEEGPLMVHCEQEDKVCR